jgi:hypothetical protein
LQLISKQSPFVKLISYLFAMYLFVFMHRCFQNGVVPFVLVYVTTG